jgi:hypothetical protein
VLTPEIARHLARKKLTAVADGADSSADRQGVRVGMSVKEVCDWYLEQAEGGRLLGRNRRPIKASTLKSDRSRIETHIKPLLGARLVSRLTLHDIEGMQADIAAGRLADGRKDAGAGRSGALASPAERSVHYGHCLATPLVSASTLLVSASSEGILPKESGSSPSGGGSAD